MKPDIENTADITLLVDTFYTKVFEDDIIGYVFKQAPGFNKATHLPLMVTFWQALLLGMPGYKGNATLKHVELSKHIPLSASHFERWLQLWQATVLQLFEGEKANMAIAKAQSIGAIMQYKVTQTSML
ncbi:MAG: group III truncated hemoglobin [Bacteroidia bacterium]|nr:group III truncated hemoglobin [Bacteroidia bacterium]